MAAKAFFYDIETLRNCTVFVFINHKDPTDRKIFVIHELRNDFTALMDFLENCSDNREYQIGFNSLSFDSQICQSLLVNRKALEFLSAEVISGKIYKKAQSMISTQEYGDFYNGTPEWKLSIPQVDVFKLNHWDFPGRNASLKWLQFTCDWKSVQEMPIHHSSRLTTLEEIQTVIDYCVNDVEFTGVIYEKSKGMLGIRKVLKTKYKLRNCLSYSDTKLGSEILLKMYCKRTGKKTIDIKGLRTPRTKISVNDIIFPYIEFKTPEFQNVLMEFKNLVFGSAEDKFKKSTILKEVRYDFGKGGIHARHDKGIYSTDNEYLIIDCDVASLYPSIAIANGMYPEHLGPVFTEVYKEDIVDVRLAEKAKGKAGDKGIVDGFKQASNSAYGNSNQKNSWLFDLQYTMQTTINGQLILSMLCESIATKLDSQILQANTDGITARIHRTDIEDYYKICEEWQKTTMVKLEFVECDTMWMWDVNCYYLKYLDPLKETKVKGRLGFKDLEPHRDKSFLVVNKAIYEFFVNGIFPEEYLKTNRNIYDWCGGGRVTSEWDFVGTCVNEGLVEYTPLQKVVRYYISNKGCKIVKINKNDNRRINLVAGKWYQTVFNDFVEMEWESYDLNEQYYLELIRKEIEVLQKKETRQLCLF